MYCVLLNRKSGIDVLDTVFSIRLSDLIAPIQISFSGVYIWALSIARILCVVELVAIFRLDR